MDDGTGRVVVINIDLISPNDIVLDPDQTLMYWCDGGKKVIGKARDLIISCDRAIHSPNRQWLIQIESGELNSG